MNHQSWPLIESIFLGLHLLNCIGVCDGSKNRDCERENRVQRGTNIITLYYQNDKSFSDATVRHKYTY